MLFVLFIYVRSLIDRESMETLLHEHGYPHSQFRALIGADLSPHDQLVNAAGNEKCLSYQTL